MGKATNVTNDLLDEETEFEEILVIEMGKLHGNSALCVQALPNFLCDAWELLSTLKQPALPAPSRQAHPFASLLRQQFPLMTCEF